LTFSFFSFLDFFGILNTSCVGQLSPRGASAKFNMNKNKNNYSNQANKQTNKPLSLSSPSKTYERNPSRPVVNSFQFAVCNCREQTCIIVTTYCNELGRLQFKVASLSLSKEQVSMRPNSLQWVTVWQQIKINQGCTLHDFTRIFKNFTRVSESETLHYLTSNFTPHVHDSLWPVDLRFGPAETTVITSNAGARRCRWLVS
jgi:hypothetical protein